MKEKYSRSDLESTRFIISLIRKCEVISAQKEDLSELHARLRTRIHQMEFYDFLTGVIIRKSRVLEEGLSAIFEAPEDQYPWDIRADSLMLYRKWLVGKLDPHLLRGITDKKGKDASGKNSKSRSFDKNFPDRVSCNHVGEGNLVNGQWWPLQMCAMRDGAHGEIEAGIHGQVGKGAYSIVVSGGGYADIDRGDSIEYCGTSGTAGRPTTGTKFMKDSFQLDHPVRVLRASSLQSPYRPAKGLRYDGLYRIVGCEVLDLATEMHRFSLERCGGQDPIRYVGVEARPTAEELAEYAKVRGLLGVGR